MAGNGDGRWDGTLLRHAANHRRAETIAPRLLITEVLDLLGVRVPDDKVVVGLLDSTSDQKLSSIVDRMIGKFATASRQRSA